MALNHSFRRRWLALLAFSWLLVACAGGQEQAAAPPPLPASPNPTTAPPATATSPEPTTPPEPFSRPAWQRAGLTDVRSGEQFTLADLAGNTVILEAMAVWCPLCDQQQVQINSALVRLGEGTVAVSLDVDPGEDAAYLAQHADQLGLGWRFVVAGNDLSVMLQAEFGPRILNPTATPVVIIGPDGRFTITPSGLKNSNQLIQFVNEARQ